MGLYAPKATVTQTEFANNSSKSSLAKQHVCIIKKQIQFFAYYQYFIGINQLKVRMSGKKKGVKSESSSEEEMSSSEDLSGGFV